ncbi:hypothetical protein ACFLQ7_01800 [Actinomycetota bacterium]
MPEDNLPPEHHIEGSAAFEADMRQRSELMEQMAGREHWEFDPVWVRAGRVAGIALVWIAGVAFVVWAVFALLQG